MKVQITVVVSPDLDILPFLEERMRKGVEWIFNSPDVRYLNFIVEKPNEKKKN